MSATLQHIATIEGLARSVQRGTETFDTILRSMGGGMTAQKYVEAVKETLSSWGSTAHPAAVSRSLAMRQKRERESLAAEQAKEWVAAGYEAYRPKQEVYTTIVRIHLDGCESEIYPSATKTVRDVVGEKAEKLLGRTNKKYLRKAFGDNKEHPAMQRIKSIADNSAVVAAASGTVSTCLGALANTHKVARMFEVERKDRVYEQEQQRERTNALIVELAEVRKEVIQARADAARANARLDTEEQWKSDAVNLYRAGFSFSAISKAVGKGKSTVNDYIRRLSSTQLIDL